MTYCRGVASVEWRGGGKDAVSVGPAGRVAGLRQLVSRAPLRTDTLSMQDRSTFELLTLIEQM